MSELKFISRWLLMIALFTLGSFILAENNLAKEVSIKAHEPTSDVATEAEITTMMNKLASARDLLDSFWRKNFADQNLSYTSPKTVAYTGSVNTGCGVIGRGNAAYCFRSHTIYFDVNFFARMMKLTSTNLKSDGDMAVIAIFAHEWGHAAQFQTGTISKLSIMRELEADCLSGAFARYATEKGMLEEGDTKEAAFAFAMGGDNSPWFAPQAHGDSRLRVGSFTLGFQEGVPGCHQ
jgi:predicted metalloprotease